MHPRSVSLHNSPQLDDLHGRGWQIGKGGTNPPPINVLPPDGNFQAMPIPIPEKDILLAASLANPKIWLDIHFQERSNNLIKIKEGVMKRLFCVIPLVLVFGVAILAKTQTGSVEQEIIKLETEWGAAVAKQDATTIDKMLADEFTMIFDGTVFTKAELLEYIKSYKEELTSFVTDEWNVHVYGDAAVVTARNTRKMKLEGKEVTSQDRFTDTWIKQDGAWKCVAGHNSTIAQK
jgi:uncharacterized protein (TIGR02246 family)